MGTRTWMMGVLLLLVLEACRQPVRRDAWRDTYTLPPVPVSGPSSSSAASENKPATIESPAAAALASDSFPASELPAFKESLSELMLRLEDAYFSFNQHDLQPAARVSLQHDAAVLRTIFSQAPSMTMMVEGHCDERGSAEYNLALGALRAEAAKDFLVDLGVPGVRLRTVTYGKERPQCTRQTEDCWQKNRRAHLAPNQ